MAKIYRFQEHALVVEGEKHDMLRLAKLLRDAEGTIGDLRYQIEYAFDVDGIRSENGCDDPDFADNNYLKQ